MNPNHNPANGEFASKGAAGAAAKALSGGGESGGAARAANIVMAKNKAIGASEKATGLTDRWGFTTKNFTAHSDNARQARSKGNLRAAMQHHEKAATAHHALARKGGPNADRHHDAAVAHDAAVEAIHTYLNV